MSKLTGISLDRAVANAMGIKSVNNCEQWGKEMTDLTEKNLEAALLNLIQKDKPITAKPTTWFGNPAKKAQWYTCPKCRQQSPLTFEWVGLTNEEIDELMNNYDVASLDYARAIEAKYKERNT